MKRSTFSAMASTLLLVACAGNPFDKTSNPHQPNVSVISGYVVVNLEPIVIDKNEKDVWITWQLTPGSPYTFPNDGIVIAGAGDEFNCHREENKQRFSCKDKHSKPGRYKYTIRVDGPENPEPLDPSIMNL